MTVNTYGLEQLVKVPTRVTASTRSLIDHVYTYKKDLVKSIDVPCISASDHYPIYVTWGKCKTSKGGILNNITYRSIKNFNKYQLLSDLKDDFDKTNFEHDLDNEVSNMNSTLLRNMNKHAPLVTRSVNGSARK